MLWFKDMQTNIVHHWLNLKLWKNKSNYFGKNKMCNRCRKWLKVVATLAEKTKQEQRKSRAPQKHVLTFLTTWLTNSRKSNVIDTYYKNEPISFLES